ncbi:ABC transporter permease [Vallitalea longa]|nr:ABC transporter permease [Vallitalea longa]
MSKIFRIFRKDTKIATRDAILIYIIIIPIILAVGILLFAPGLNDSSVKIAMLKSDEAEHVAYMEKYAQIELFNNIEDLERRVNKRDDVVGIAPTDNGYEIIVQGNEAEGLADYPEILNSLYELGVTEENTTATNLSFEKTVPPLKTKLVNMLILLVVMLAGMIISLGIVEEKSDNTISAVNVTPVSQTGFVLGKSALGSITSLVSIILVLLITGYHDVNWLMIILVGFTSMLLSLIIGFLQGLSSSDVIEAAAGVKIMMLPIAGSIAGYELLSDKWQWTMYWSPFYFAYKANDMILSKIADWGTVIICVVAVIVLTLLVYLISIPKIRRGLS